MLYHSTICDLNDEKLWQKFILREAKLRTWILVNQDSFNDYINDFLNSIIL
jgi:hypothetical protein